MWGSLQFDDRLKIAGLCVTILLAFAGWAFTSRHAHAVARRKARLDRVTRQLKDLYGPLYATVLASTIAWLAFRSRYRPGGSFWGRDPAPTDAEVDAWVLWMKNVFAPLNERIENVIISNADLLDEPMPACFLEACAHVAAYKTVLARWERGDFSEYTSVNNFPVAQLRTYIEPRYAALQAEQQTLLGMLHRNVDGR